MLHWIHRRLRAQEGLTLIELIVVVAIIAILAFTITPRVLDALNNSKLNGARSVANELHSALERYYANAGTTGVEHYPTDDGTNVITTFAALRTALGDTLGLTNTTENVIADNGSGAPQFTYTPQELDATGSAWEAAEVNDLAAFYCIQFQARDRDGTWFTVSPEGIEEATGAAAACPTAP